MVRDDGVASRIATAWQHDGATTARVIDNGPATATAFAREGARLPPGTVKVRF